MNNVCGKVGVSLSGGTCIAMAAEVPRKCAYCQEAFKDPKVLPCFHILCKECVGYLKIPGVEELKCPVDWCNKKFTCQDPEHLPDAAIVHHHQDLQRFKQELKEGEKMCNICQTRKWKRVRAVARCDHCEDICYTCKQLHSTRDEYSDHTVVTFLELSQQQDDVQHVNMLKQFRSMSFARTALNKCKIHPKNFNTSYCFNCKAYACTACIKIAHADHVHKVVSAAAAECADTLAGRIAPIQEARNSLLDAIESIKQTRDTVTDQQAALTSNVNSTFNSLVKILEHRREELKVKIGELTKSKVSKLSAQQLDLERLAGELDRMAGFTEKVLRSSTERELLTAYPFLHDRTKESLDSATKKALHPTETANISLKMSSVKKDLKNLCHKNIDIFLKQADPSCCSAEGAGLQSAQTMQCSQFAINVANKNQRPCFSIQDVVVEVERCQHVTETTALVRETGVGRYLVSFYPKFRGKHEIHVSVNENAIPGSPFLLDVDMPRAQLGTSQGCIHDVNFPRGIVLGPNEKILICEWNGTKIVEMDTIGRRSRMLDCEDISHPASLALSSSGDIFVVDGVGSNSGVKKLDETGKVLASASGEGLELGKFNSPRGIKINSKNEVFVCDRDNSRIQVFDINLDYQRCIDLAHLNVETKPKPNDLAFDGDNIMYVSDYANNCIHQLGPNEEYLASFSESTNGQLAGPECIAVDTSGFLYVTESQSHRVSVFKTSGECVRAFGCMGKAEGELNFPVGITVDKSGNIYVCELYNNRIQVF